MENINVKGKSKPNVYAIIGPSAVGTSSSISELLSTGNFYCPPSLTTREPKTGEIDLREKNIKDITKGYYFYSKEEFEELLKKGKIFEYDEMYGNYYGYTNEQLQEAINTGKTLLLQLSPNAYEFVKKSQSDLFNLVTFHILPLKKKDLLERAIRRNRDELPKILERYKADLETRKKWKAIIDEYVREGNNDYYITNKDLEKSVEYIKRIFSSYKLVNE